VPSRKPTYRKGRYTNAGVFDSKASDQELITKAKQLPEVKAFLAKY
jgi:hypothetical protein